MINKIRKAIVSVILSAATLFSLSTAAFSETYMGDVNGDGKVNSLDALGILKWRTGKGTIDQSVADYNHDGKINASDALAILKDSAAGVHHSSSGESQLTENKYYYSTLTKEEKSIYSNIVTAIQNFDEKAYFPNFDYYSGVSTLNKIFQLVKYENPDLFYASSNSWSYGSYNSTSYIVPKYTLTKTQANNMKKKLDEKADAILKKASNAADDKERARIIHDEIINMTRYRVDYNDRSNAEADGPLLKGYARCEGYARAFAYVAQKAGIQTICVTNTQHMWNMINLDGKWYHVDLTFDDPNGAGDILNHNYFCVDDSVLAAEGRRVTANMPYPTNLRKE